MIVLPDDEPSVNAMRPVSSADEATEEVVVSDQDHLGVDVARGFAVADERREDHP